MQFNTIAFIFVFLPISVLIYGLVPYKYKGFVLTFFSLLFYSHYDLGATVHLLVFAIIVYLFGMLLHSSEYKKSVLAVELTIIVAYLVYFKYYNFLADNFMPFLSKIRPDNLVTPLGISFYTFTAISYLVDTYKERIKTNFFRFLNYLTFFPKIISGPIVRLNKFGNVNFSAENLSYGISRFIMGLSKKTIFAYYFGLSADAIWNQLHLGIDTPTAWIGALAYTFQIYFDFSGYSDMAIGIASMFGYPIADNFNFPYLSRSISEFWRRWHISLGDWFKNYIYIPLGGSRHGNIYFNLFMVFLITGIWHGASWAFIVWGLWHGLFRIIEKALEKNEIYNRIPDLIKWAFTMFVVVIGWVLFRSNGLREAMVFLNRMFVPGTEGTEIVYTWKYFLNHRLIVLFIFSFLGSTVLGKFDLGEDLYQFESAATTIQHILYTLALIVLFVISLSMILSSGHLPFIYFQF